ncbi:ABC transporter ATP-binding protein [Ferrimicrobium acidiphilum]|uniref:Glutathione import ATP-binding protein GsiA n=1 Tax=Ferrimicrobium acidiphilum DSM 19497 TaxID=1121877 RepID=A0A0D8FYC1_9ACTN|nr:ABC transporter ATP-binding protein [Ferrimicrobium acidiphilum]KJE77989.1 glutathione import ATP-binding protein GsiA [Ferrimicrobium acidiphilum DSM 19497]
MPLLEINDLHTHIRLRKGEVRAVDGVSFEVNVGETVGLVGESGSGKTMTGMSVLGLLPTGGYMPRGEILFDGVDLTKLSQSQMRKYRGNDIAMVFQDPMTSLNPVLTIGDQIAETARLHLGMNKTDAEARAIEVLSLVGMPNPKERLTYFPHQLSGGLRQRVMIAMALTCDPKLLILDEPTTALDVTIQAQILELLEDLKDRLSMAMILVTHDMGVIAGRADNVVVMYAGRVAELAPAKELFQMPYHPYTEALLASIPPLEGAIPERLYSIPGLPPDLSTDLVGCRFAPRCRYVQDRCRVEEPPFETPDGYPHPFTCFYPVSAPDRIPVKIVRRDQALSKTGREAIIELDHVVKEYPVTKGALVQRKIGTVKAVTDVSFSVYRGETFGIVGESGCGKTTTGSMIVGLEDVTDGDIRFKGKSIIKDGGHYLKSVRRDLQLMFQDPYASLDPRMRVKDILSEPLTIHRMGTQRERDVTVARLLREVGLSPTAADRYPHEFSGGQRQRIGLARALALQPDVIVADEPVSALDVSIRSQVLNLMKDLQAEHDLTYIIISHDLSVVRFMADRIAVMYLGKLVEIGTEADIFQRAKHPYTHMLLDVVPEANPEVELAKEHGTVRGEIPSAITPPSGCRFRTRCAYAQDRCAEELPDYTKFGDEHYAACFFPMANAPRFAEAEAVS